MQIQQLENTLKKGTFSSEELSLLKLLVLESLEKYSNKDITHSGNILSMCQQLIGKLNYMKGENV